MTHPMTRRLEAALNSLTAAERRAIIQALGERTGNAPLERLHRGLRSELIAMDMREIQVLAALEADGAAERREHLDDVERRVFGDPPAIEGEPFWPLGGGPDAE